MKNRFRYDPKKNVSGEDKNPPPPPSAQYMSRKNAKVREFLKQMSPQENRALAAIHAAKPD